MVSSRLEQFIRFGTDAAGIERMLRMIQAILMVTLSQPFLTRGFTNLVELGNRHVWVEPRAASIASLSQLRGQVALTRRFFRIFRFLESFQAAHVIYTSFYLPPTPASPLEHSSQEGATVVEGEKREDVKQEKPKSSQNCSNPNCRNHHPPKPRSGVPTEAWLDIFSRTFNGMYLLLEALTLIDALALPGLSLFGSHWFPILHVEAQRFWFFALVCGLFSGLLKLVKLMAYGPVPQTGEGYGLGGGKDEKEMADWERQRERMRKIVWARKERIGEEVCGGFVGFSGTGHGSGMGEGGAWNSGSLYGGFDMAYRVGGLGEV
ncbi:NADH dehydrogenase [ubiquinone] flavoprotein 1, mitochondrial [Gnomoniopsis smithogilvyi]|uniref:NADH dehydrogenase [ubiquinone] flavoprotein 1, mitochondrial n=1 Tax=Gnomoniopsis smithogilvyi TaxID=1191159 RepID=A0A9W8YZA9_9PEZI|nr:NADH dehydrogenase [ubiquinone] flavoprotein 1, mitochondrial [Gnomoniopsis smithogilvyi]